MSCGEPFRYHRACYHYSNITGECCLQKRGNLKYAHKCNKVCKWYITRAEYIGKMVDIANKS